MGGGIEVGHNNIYILCPFFRVKNCSHNDRRLRKKSIHGGLTWANIGGGIEVEESVIFYEVWSTCPQLLIFVDSPK